MNCLKTTWYRTFKLQLKSCNYSNNVMYCTESMPAKGTRT